MSSKYHKTIYENDTLAGDNKYHRTIYENDLLGTTLYDFFSSNDLQGFADNKEKYKKELLGALEEDLVGKWHKPWKPAISATPKGKILNGYHSPYYKTYRLINEMNLRAAYKNVQAITAPSNCFITKYYAVKNNLEITTDKKLLNAAESFVFQAWVKEEEVEVIDKQTGKKSTEIKEKFGKGIQTVYNAAILKDRKWEDLEIDKTPVNKDELNEYVQNFINKLEQLNKIPTIFYDQNDRCCYMPSKDELHLVSSDRFENNQEFFSTLFHEITHSTGHKTRCKRKFAGSFGDAEYGYEELVAEFGANLLCAELGLQYKTVNSLIYLKGWLLAAEKLGGKEKVLVGAYSDACNAVEYLLKNIDLNELLPKTIQDEIKNNSKLDGIPENYNIDDILENWEDLKEDIHPDLQNLRPEIELVYSLYSKEPICKQAIDEFVNVVKFDNNQNKTTNKANDQEKQKRIKLAKAKIAIAAQKFLLK